MAQSIQVCAIRVTRLNSSGVPLTGASNGFIGKAPITVKVTPDVEAGVELKATNGCGVLCGYYQAPDQLKKYNVSFELCDMDNELIELLTNEPVVLNDEDEVIGRTSQRVATCAPTDFNGVAVELWSKRWDACGPASDGLGLYWHWFWPRAFLRTGEFTMENDFARVPIEGYLQENPFFDHGAWTSSPWPADDSLEALYGVVAEATIPDAEDGYQTVS